MTHNTVTEIENADILTTDEVLALRCIARSPQTLDGVEAFLRVAFRGWFVYRGGSHVALHVKSGGVRVLIVKEVK